MKVFVTGAHGYIGKSVASQLVASGHTVIGLAHHDRAASALQEAGHSVHRGSLDDLDSLRAGAAAADGVIHLAFNHDFTQYGKAIETDRAALTALGEVLVGTDKPLVYAQGMVSPGDEAGIQREDDEFDPKSAFTPRALADNVAKDLASRGVRIATVRLPTTVHSYEDKGMIPILIGAAVKAGQVGYVGEGTNHWASVHRNDAARLFVMAFEALANGQLKSGKALHAIADKGIETREIAQVIADKTGLPTQSVDAAEMQKRAGLIGMVWGVNVRADNQLTKEWVGWEPKEIGLLQDIKENYAVEGNPEFEGKKV